MLNSIITKVILYTCILDNGHSVVMSVKQCVLCVLCSGMTVIIIVYMDRPSDDVNESFRIPMLSSGHAKLCMRGGRGWQRQYSHFVAASPAVMVTAVTSENI